MHTVNVIEAYNYYFNKVALICFELSDLALPYQLKSFVT